MAEVCFYHCTRMPPDAVLPALLSRTLASRERAVVLCDAARLPALDQDLWTYGWLPHGDEGVGDPALQPIWLTAREEAPNGARFLFLLDGVAWRNDWTRVFDLFDGNDRASVEAARGRWRAARAAGHTPTYFQQGAQGWMKGT